MNKLPVEIPVAQESLVPTSSSQFRIFTILWAIASLFHMAHSSVFDTQLNFALLTLAALYAIVRPSLASFIVLAMLQLFDAFFRMPFTTNHWIFTAFVNLTILQCVLYLVFKRRSFSISERELLSTSGPLVRMEVIILYFFAVFHKLNSGFFTPETSCASELLQAQHIDSIIPISPAMYKANAWFTIVLESMIPLFLCFRKTRNFAIAAGIIFHCILSYSTYNAFYDFSSMVFAVYFLFASPQWTESMLSLASRIKASTSRWLSRWSVRKTLMVLASAMFVLLVIYAINKKLDEPRTVNLYFFWTAYSLIFTFLFLRYWFLKKDDAIAPKLFQSQPVWFYIIPVIVFLNGTSPYLGLKTENSYAMFSNLKTEGGATNHFIVPASSQIFEYQKNVIQIVSSSDPGLQKLARENKGLIFFEFRNYVNERKPAKVEYLLNGERSVYVKGETKLGKNPYVLAKLMKFRPFAIEGAQPCSH